MPFDEEIFVNRWGAEPDPVLTALLESGAVVNSAELTANLQGAGLQYTIPFLKDIDNEDPLVNDGKTDLTTKEVEGDTQSGTAYKRWKGWTARDFINDVQGADPMGHIIGRVAKYWNKYRQRQIIALLNGIFGITGDTELSQHIYNVATTGSSVTDANKIGATTLNDAITKALGDHKDSFAMAIMHSNVAKTLENLQLLEYSKYTDPSGITRPLNIGYYNGKLVIVDDGMPVADSATATGEKEYTTYLLGTGSILMGKGNQSYPVEAMREPTKNGGQDTLITRVTEALHPNGFSFEPTTKKLIYNDTELFDSASWKRKMPHKTIPMAKLVTNG
ncbi:MAG: coat protein [Clostridia bacterium]|nr:coat protein [Clostridia bacterium]MCI9412966.1 coat protein [Clostridia bacterium]